MLQSAMIDKKTLRNAGYWIILSGKYFKSIFKPFFKKI